jgi:hypothetical protein
MESCVLLIGIRSSIVKEIVNKRFSISDHGQRRDMMGSFIRHGITKTEAVSEATLQMYAPFNLSVHMTEGG